MPKYYCDYCDTYLTHDSPSVRKTHCSGRKHRDNVKFYYQKWMEEQAQHLIDATTAAFKAGIVQNPFTAVPPPKPQGVAIPPPANMMAPPRGAPHHGLILGTAVMPPTLMMGPPPTHDAMQAPSHMMGMRPPSQQAMMHAMGMLRPPPPPLGAIAGMRPA